MVVGKRTYNPSRSWYVCSYHLKRGDTVCSNGVGIPVVEALGHIPSVPGVRLQLALGDVRERAFPTVEHSFRSLATVPAKEAAAKS